MDAGSKQKIINAFGLLCAGAAIGGICVLLYCQGGRSSSAGADSASATQQAQRITELNGLARAENQSARAAVEHADERAAEAGAINQRVTQRLEGSKELLGQIRADNQRAKQILDELIAGYQKRPAQGEKN